MFLLGEGGLAKPRHAFTTHLGEGFGGAVHEQRHEMATDATCGAATIRHFGGTIVGAAGTEIGSPFNRRDGLFCYLLHAVKLRHAFVNGRGVSVPADTGGDDAGNLSRR